MALKSLRFWWPRGCLHHATWLWKLPCLSLNQSRWEEGNHHSQHHSVPQLQRKALPTWTPGAASSSLHGREFGIKAGLVTAKLCQAKYCNDTKQGFWWCVALQAACQASLHLRASLWPPQWGGTYPPAGEVLLPHRALCGVRQTRHLPRLSPFDGLSSHCVTARKNTPQHQDSVLQVSVCLNK